MDPSQLLSLNVFTTFKVLLFMILLVSLFLWFGALASGLQNITPVNIIITASAAIGAQWLVAILLSTIPGLGGILGFIFSMIAMIYIFKRFLQITWEQALIVFLLTVVAEVSAGTVIKLFLKIDIWAFARTFIFIV